MGRKGARSIKTAAKISSGYEMESIQVMLSSMFYYDFKLLQFKPNCNRDFDTAIQFCNVDFQWPAWYLNRDLYPEYFQYEDEYLCQSYQRFKPLSTI